MDTNVGKTKIKINSTRNIFCFVVFDDFYFFLSAKNFVFGVFIFSDFAFFFATGGARRKIQNRQKGDFQIWQKKNQIHKKYHAKKGFEHILLQFRFPDIQYIFGNACIRYVLKIKRIDEIRQKQI